MTQREKKVVRFAAAETDIALPDDLHPVLRRVYGNRAITRSDELQLELKGLLPVSSLSGCKQAAELLHRVMARQGHILVVADFDADGATSCALAVRALRAMGADHVSYLVPNRFEYGYGLTPEIVAVALQQAPDLIVTVDNGISSVEGVAVARAAGVQVLVTDHHLPGSELPAADVLVNPNLPGDSFPSKHLAGVGVIFYVLAALSRHLHEAGWFAARSITAPAVADWLDLVALGTVADVVPLDHNNRILVQQGLLRIRAGRCCAGINALIQLAQRSRQRLVTADLGFAIGPRLNAAGRLQAMSIGIECLLTDDPVQAQALAALLDGLNRERRQIEQEMQQEALSQLDELVPATGLPHGLCLFREAWHQGVIGILAARIRERIHRPVIAFAPGECEGVIKGSARSIPGLHIRDTLDAVAARHPGLLEKFGGHAMAAGLSLQRDDFTAFATAFDDEVKRRLDEDALQDVIHSDGSLSAADLSLDLAEWLRAAGPWGQGFPEPRFDDHFRIVQQRIVGERHLKLVLQPQSGGDLVDAIAFNQAEQRPDDDAVIHAVYRLDVNEYRGNRSLQLMIDYFRPLDE